jgi:uncharacterized protein YeaO (DUF488 family)
MEKAKIYSYHSMYDNSTNEDGNSMKLKIKRVYDKPAEEDGTRILVDRLWPRGLTKQKAKVDVWLKDIAPSTELRKWFAHDPEKWKEFIKKYKKELHENKEQAAILKEYLRQGNSYIGLRSKRRTA